MQHAYGLAMTKLKNGTLKHEYEQPADKENCNIFWLNSALDNIRFALLGNTFLVVIFKYYLNTASSFSKWPVLFAIILKE